jgi:hypothetical protein
VRLSLLVLRPLLAYCTSPRWWWLWRIWWNEDWQGNRSTRRRPAPGPLFSTTNPTWLDPGSNPGRRGGKPAANRLSYGAAKLQHYFSNTRWERKWPNQIYRWTYRTFFFRKVVYPMYGVPLEMFQTGNMKEVLQTFYLKCEFFFCKSVVNRPWRPVGLWDVEAPTFYRQSDHRWWWGCQP